VSPSRSVSTLCRFGTITPILVRFYMVQMVYSHIGPFSHGGVCVQPSWSVSTQCTWYTAILVRVYTVQLVYRHLDPSLHGATCVHIYWSVSTRFSLFICALIRLYMVKLVCSLLGPSLHVAVCVEPSWSISTCCILCTFTNTSILVRLYFVTLTPGSSTSKKKHLRCNSLPRQFKLLDFSIFHK
jgi:hypothetical protein